MGNVIPPTYHRRINRNYLLNIVMNITDKFPGKTESKILFMFLFYFFYYYYMYTHIHTDNTKEDVG